MNKYSLNLGKLIFIISCIALMVLFAIWIFDNYRISKIECLECERELHNIDTCNKKIEFKISVIDSLIHNIQSMDSIFSLRILRTPIIQQTNIQTKSELDLQFANFVETQINKSKCKNHSLMKKRLEYSLKWLKSSEIKCDKYLALILDYAKKDSIYRKKLNLELVPYEILFNMNNDSSNSVNNIVEPDYTKELTSKIRKLSWQTFMMFKSYNEINEYQDRK